MIPIPGNPIVAGRLQAAHRAARQAFPRKGNEVQSGAGMDPRTIIQGIERHASLPPGRGDRFAGYAVIGLPFRSGHVLSLRRFPASAPLAFPAGIRIQLRDNSERTGRLLKFVVDRVLERGASEISEYELAAEIFHRGDSFDPRLDSIVRVEASRMLAKLATYYETEGRPDTVEIYFPRKGYVPSFRFRSACAATSRKGIGVLPLNNLAVVIDQFRRRSHRPSLRRPRESRSRRI